MAKPRSTKIRAKKSPAPARLPAAGKNKKLKVAIVGLGTVGRSVAKLLCRDPNGPFLLTHIFNRGIQRKKTDSLPAHIRWTDKIGEVLSSDVDVVVELIGGLKPAGDWVRRALRAGKSVVTANKLLISESGPELADLARKMGKRIEFGASVAGGIPAIIGIQEGLAGDRLYKIAGILNGTCNFILTKMEASGTSFQAALKEAQELGFAEADPSADVDGIDARAKLVILTQAGLGLRVRSDQILARSISSIEAVDFMYARDLSCSIRQISLAEKVIPKEPSRGVRLAAAVQPALIPAASLMAHARGSQNIVTAFGEYAGRMVFSGYGAGGDPTAVAVVSDLYAIARSAGAPPAALPKAAEVPDSVSADFTVPHYLRFVVRDRPGIVAALATILANYQISIDALLQKPGFPHDALSFVMTLESCDSAVLNRALEEIARLDFHVEPPLCLPIFTD
ncbi:MAG TPA: homoserine dehydrogenase [Candidatus Polarisedimenticolia bacterium]|nr:homoserine dehydrogenase [Candidatus Polarisedimenticolia bacterium]